MNKSDEERKEAQRIRQQLGEMVRPLLRRLDDMLDKRLVATFFAALQAIITLVDARGKRPVWHMTCGKRSRSHRLIHDARRRCDRKMGMIFLPVTHPDFPDTPLTLVVSRPGAGRTPWYLLTNLPVVTDDDAWSVIFMYARRWQIEMTYRFAKTELAMESPRLWFWHNRLKLLAMVALVYAFLLSLLAPRLAIFRAWLLRRFCHRTGKRYRAASIPLYRLRLALSLLCLAYPDPIPLPLQQTSG
jgi:hypothetical protein